jgi:hypothetical protein
MPSGSTIPLFRPISPAVRDFRGSSLAHAWVPVLGLSAAVAARDRRSDAGDLLYFVHQGERMLSGRWADTFADPTLQAGPLQLLLAGAVRNMSALAFVIEVGVVALLLFVLVRMRVPARWQLAVGAAAVAAGLTHGAFVDGHPAEAITPLLWVLAAIDARRGRTVRAGAIVGLSAGFELWGMLGVAVLLLAPSVRAFVRGVATQVGVVAALFAPFVLFGRFAMFDYHWRVARGTALAAVVAPGMEFGWSFRLLQAAVACGCGAAIAWRMRRDVNAVWLVPFVVVVARILLDPLAYGWYWLEALALALVGAALLVTAPPLRLQRARQRTAVDRSSPAAPPPPVHS